MDPRPDLVVEVDLHRESVSKFPIYASLGVIEIWRFNGESLETHQLRNGTYEAADASLAFPMLTAGRLTEWLRRSESESQYDVLSSAEDWLKSV